MKNPQLIPFPSKFSHPIPAEFFFSTPNPVYAVAMCPSSGLPPKGTFGVTGELILRIRRPFCHLTNGVKAQTNQKDDWSHHQAVITGGLSFLTPDIVHDNRQNSTAQYYCF